MAIKTILVPLEGDETDSSTLTFAGPLAKQLGAHLTALYADPDPRQNLAMMVGDGSFYISQDVVDAMQARSDERRETARRLRDAEAQKKVDEAVTSIFGDQADLVRSAADRAAVASVDARREITAQEWAEAVRRAKLRVVEQTKAAPAASRKMRDAKRRHAVSYRRHQEKWRKRSNK